MFIAAREADDAFDQVIDVTKAPRLAAVAVNREPLATESLHHEVRDDAAVAGVQARAIGVEDAHHARIHAARTVVSHDHGFAEALGFVVDRARTNWIDVSPIGFLLRMLERVAI